MKKIGIAALIILLALLAAQYLPAQRGRRSYIINGTLGPVPIPAHNPQTPAKISLGKQLFFDKRLSSDSTVSCATCHDPKEAWADRSSISRGVGHKMGKRNTPTILNAGYSVPQFWDGRAILLEKQAVGPVENPLEMDLPMPQLIARLNNISGYRTQFITVFGEEANAQNIAMAIASFERTINNPNSPYDRYVRGNRRAMNAAAIRGMKLFGSKRAGCTNCHSGPYFSDSKFHNAGVGYVRGRYKDVGRYDVTKDPRDMGAFLTPTLRNAQVTPPYMHDGSEKTLAQVIEFYDRGGNRNPHLDKDIKPLHLTRRQKADLVEFIKSLTGKPVIVSEPVLPR